MPCVRHLPRCTDCSPRPYEEVHRALARRAAEEGIILLKNENHTLPLPSGCRIALYGTGALHTFRLGSLSSISYSESLRTKNHKFYTGALSAFSVFICRRKYAILDTTFFPVFPSDTDCRAR